eukprot:4870504-Pyramimonas_sp.AAC.1
MASARGPGGGEGVELVSMCAQCLERAAGRGGVEVARASAKTHAAMWAPRTCKGPCSNFWARSMPSNQQQRASRVEDVGGVHMRGQPRELSGGKNHTLHRNCTPRCVARTSGGACGVVVPNTACNACPTVPERRDLAGPGTQA